MIPAAFLRICKMFLSPTIMFYQLSNWILILIITNICRCAGPGEHYRELPHTSQGEIPLNFFDFWWININKSCHVTSCYFCGLFLFQFRVTITLSCGLSDHRKIMTDFTKSSKRWYFWPHTQLSSPYQGLCNRNHTNNQKTAVGIASGTRTERGDLPALKAFYRIKIGQFSRKKMQVLVRGENRPDQWIFCKVSYKLKHS